MKLSGAAFLAQPRKALTLIGMSGVGKSWLAQKLEGWGWESYSCDELIGGGYLGGEIGKTLPSGEIPGGDTMALLSEFVGKLGDPARGGLGLAEFRRRQRLYYEAECRSLLDMADALQKSEGNFVCDSSGSLCEVEDGRILEAVGRGTLVVYLKVQQEGHAEILERAFKHPKPLFFPPDFLEERLRFYREEFDLKDVSEIDPLEFLRWIFPFLFESRLPKYQAIADRYGVTIGAHELAGIDSEDAFLQRIAGALDE